MGGVRHAKELNDIVVYNGLRVLGPLQTERKLSSGSRIAYCKHTLLQTSHGKLLLPHGCVLQGPLELEPLIVLMEGHTRAHLLPSSLAWPLTEARVKEGTMPTHIWSQLAFEQRREPRI